MEVEYVLRHLLASLKYRCSKAITNVQENYPIFEVGGDVRKPIEILSHISCVLRHAQSIFDKDIKIHEDLESWEEEVEKFYKEIKALDRYISSGLPDEEKILEKLLQGPLSDTMAHVGQLSMIRRMSGDPIPGENFFNADIRI